MVGEILLSASVLKFEVEEVTPALIEISPLKPGLSASLANAGAAATLSTPVTYI
ncbi:hypothetical protein OK016_08990 [Vibrio chagasii]|nr:hypothetical protein [Vibrio chagasii]